MKARTAKWFVTAAGVAALAGATLLSATANSSEPVPSLSEAQALLTDAWERGAAHDGAGVCDYASAKANCRIQLEGADGAWPTDEPLITCDRELAADGEYSGGYALRVEGVDSNGQAYASDVLAIGTEDGPRLMNPVFWNSTGIANGNDTSATFDVCA